MKLATASGTTTQQQTRSPRATGLRTVCLLLFAALVLSAAAAVVGTPYVVHFAGQAGTTRAWTGTGHAATAPYALQRSGRPLYVTNGARDVGVPNIARFTVGADGLLTPIDTVAAGGFTRGLVTTPDLRFAYVANGNANQIWMYRIGPDGALTRFGEIATSSPFAIAIAPNGRSLYVSNNSDRTLSAFAVGTDGRLAPLGTVDSGAINPKGVAVTPNGRFLYVSHGAPTDTAPNVLTGFAILPDGRLQALGVAVPIGISGAEVVITPDGRFVYTVHQGNNADRGGGDEEVFGFRIGADGGLTPVPGGPVAAGDFLEGAAISPDGRRLYVTALEAQGAQDGPGRVVGFTIGADGRLSPDIAPVVTNGDPVGIAFAPDGRHLYIGDFFANSVTAYVVGLAGELTPVQALSSGGSQPGFQAVSVLPNRGPLASFSARVARGYSPTRFDATRSSDRDGRVVRYDWDFGDGTVLADGGPTPAHVYRAPGSYRVRLTVTDDEGCSTELVYTGRSALCLGTRAGSATRIITVGG